nr:eukaryotic translation initiation factor 4E-like isoform X1 [Dermatophagoides farinae]
MNENCRKVAISSLIDDHDDDQIVNIEKLLKQVLNDTFDQLQSFIMKKFNMIIDSDTMNMIRANLNNNNRLLTIDNNNNNDLDSLHQLIRSISDEISYISNNSNGNVDDDDDKKDKSLSVVNIGGDFINDNHNNNGQSDQQSVSSSSTSSCNHYWQFWYWKSDQWYIEWDYGLQTLGRPFNGRQRLLWLLDQLIPLSDIVIPSDYSIFRELIRPKWEDSFNLNGGAWIIEFERCSSITDMELMENIWRSLVEFVVEKHCNNDDDHGHLEHMCGIKISNRFKVFIISIWIDTCYDLSIILYIGHRIQSIINQIIDRNRQIKLSLPDLDSKLLLSSTSSPLLLFRSHMISRKIAAKKDSVIATNKSNAAAINNFRGKNMFRVL